MELYDELKCKKVDTRMGIRPNRFSIKKELKYLEDLVEVKRDIVLPRVTKGKNG